MKKIKRQRLAGVATILALAMTLGGCGAAAETETVQEESAVTVSTKAVETGTITLTNSFVGTISPQETVMVIPLTAGTVTETFFEVGDAVKAGDVLFKIDDEAARLQYQTAQLGVENARQTSDSTMENLINQRDSTMENLLNQQDSTELQLESSKMQAQSTFESAQIGYVTAKDTYEKLDKQYKEAKKNYDSAMKTRESLERQLEDAQKREAEVKAQKASAESISDTDASGNDGVVSADSGSRAADADAEILAIQKEIAALKKQLEALGSADTLSSLESARNQAYQAYLTARSGYNTAQKAMELTDETEMMTREQLEQTMATTEEQLEQSMASTEDQLALSLDMAQLSVAQAELALDYYTVTSPVSGVVESKNVEVNGVAGQSSPAYTIVNNDTMTVTFQVSEDVRNTLSVGQNVTLERNHDTYRAAITEIGSSVNPQSGLFQIKACAEVSSAELPNGVSVKVSADTYRAENTMIIPYEAVYYENEGAYVYTSVDGRAVKTPITTGIFDDDNIVVTGGLKLGDIVVTSWSPQLTDGVLLHAAE